VYFSTEELADFRREVRKARLVARWVGRVADGLQLLPEKGAVVVNIDNAIAHLGTSPVRLRGDRPRLSPSRKGRRRANRYGERHR
jgi:hypothetical protein